MNYNIDTVQAATVPALSIVNEYHTQCPVTNTLIPLAAIDDVIRGAYLGGKMTKANPTVTRYLGLTLLPHSGVSLVFTGIAVTTLNRIDPSSASIISGTIAAAAIINEIIAVVIAKYAFKWAGEINEFIKK